MDGRWVVCGGCADGEIEGLGGGGGGEDAGGPWVETGVAVEERGFRASWLQGVRLELKLRAA